MLSAAKDSTRRDPGQPKANNGDRTPTKKKGLPAGADREAQQLDMRMGAECQNGQREGGRNISVHVEHVCTLYEVGMLHSSTVSRRAAVAAAL